MSATIEESRRKLPREDDAIAQHVEAAARLDHLHAFNFGRSLGRIEMARDRWWLCFRWLLFGAAVGVVLAAVYLQIFLNARILPIAR
jgi:hypothetical protein